MKIAELIQSNGSQVVRLPDEFRFSGDAVSIRNEGGAVILEPIKSRTWPEGFFEQICIDDPAFTRPPQGDMPPAVVIDPAS